MSSLMNASECARYLGISRTTFYHWRCKALFPKPLEIGNVKRWRKDDLLKFIGESDETIKDIPAHREKLEDYLSVRSSSALKFSGLVYVYDLRFVTENDMMRLPNFGRKCLNEVRSLAKEFEIKIGAFCGETVRCGNTVEEYLNGMREKHLDSIKPDVKPSLDPINLRMSITKHYVSFYFPKKYVGKRYEVRIFDTQGVLIPSDIGYKVSKSSSGKGGMIQILKKNTSYLADKTMSVRDVEANELYQGNIGFQIPLITHTVTEVEKDDELKEFENAVNTVNKLVQKYSAEMKIENNKLQVQMIKCIGD